MALMYDDRYWWLKITDVFAVNRWQDGDDSCRVRLPKSFPNMSAAALASFINSVPPCGPGRDGHREVKPEEVRPLIEAAQDVLG